VCPAFWQRSEHISSTGGLGASKYTKIVKEAKIPEVPVLVPVAYKNGERGEIMVPNGGCLRQRVFVRANQNGVMVGVTELVLRNLNVKVKFPEKPRPCASNTPGRIVAGTKVFNRAKSIHEHDKRKLDRIYPS
jgi:hypothetical protein